MSDPEDVIRIANLEAENARLATQNAALRGAFDDEQVPLAHLENIRLAAIQLRQCKVAARLEQFSVKARAALKGEQMLPEAAR